jgi:cobyrinic acid a,c-diamide synthase
MCIYTVIDAAFQFYYSENLDALEKEGADLIYVSPMTDHSLPDIDALYLGGGFPETQVNQLESNQSFRYALRQAIQYGLPVYAECGGLMYLGQTVIVDNKPFEMASIFSIKFDLSKRPVAHGYSVIKVCLPNPVFPVGTELRGHEFHYSRVMEWNKQTDETLAFQMIRGKGFWDQHDGLCFNQVLAAYTHVHALGTPQWAPGLVSAAKLFQTKKKDHE